MRAIGPAGKTAEGRRQSPTKMLLYSHRHAGVEGVAAIKDRLLAPEMVREFLKAYAEELAAADQEAGREQTRLEAELAETKRKLKSVMAAIEDGLYNASLRERLEELEQLKARLEAGIGSAIQTKPPARLHLASPDIYREQVAELEAG
jgi:site-specific DNA recombinase